MMAVLPSGPGLYVHVPFCRRKCPYCGFFSVPSTRGVDAYLAGLEAEAGLYGADWRRPFETLYLGGGCPSLLNLDQLQWLIETLRRHFEFAPDIELTIEANPEHLDLEKLAGYLRLGVGRLSLGAQSMDDGELGWLGRNHSASQVVNAARQARRAGFENISLDLIYALPGRTEEDWLNVLNRALALEPAHLSCYQLSFEPRTLLEARRKRGLVQPADEDTERRLFLLTHERLTAAGFEHYEVSNFARPGRVSAHNHKYWSGAAYLGLGPSAHSFDEYRRWWNPDSLKKYVAALGSGRSPVAEREVLSEPQRRLETIALSLRTSDGIDLTAFRDRFGIDLLGACHLVVADLVDRGLAVLDKGRLALTPRGWLVADALVGLIDPGE